MASEIGAGDPVSRGYTPKRSSSREHTLFVGRILPQNALKKHSPQIMGISLFWRWRTVILEPDEPPVQYVDINLVHNYFLF